MDEVALVMFETGEGYDYQETVCKVFSSKEKADAYVSEMNDKLKEDNAFINTCGHLEYDRYSELSKKYERWIDYTGGRFFVGQTITVE